MAPAASTATAAVLALARARARARMPSPPCRLAARREASRSTCAISHLALENVRPR